MERQQARKRQACLVAEGKTDESKADLARLAEIRARRELEAAKREAEIKRKEEAAAAAVAKMKKRLAAK